MLTVRIEHDPDTENPMDWDGQWKLYSFGRRHGNFKEPEELGLSLETDSDGIPIIRNPGLRRKLDVGLAFFCSYYEHGGCVWSLIDEGPQCRWDSTRIAGLLVWEHKPSDMGAKTREERAKDARGFLETYTAWCNGETYYYCIEDEEGEIIESCSGFLGPDLQYMFDEIREHVKGKDFTFEGDAAGLANYYNTKADA